MNRALQLLSLTQLGSRLCPKPRVVAPQTHRRRGRQARRRPPAAKGQTMIN
jgi:hypothetical protein